jgi:hypothetical protein
MHRDKYNDFKDEDAQFDLDLYASDLHLKGEPPRFPCYVIPHLWGKDDTCLHCGYARKELYRNEAVEQSRAADAPKSAPVCTCSMDDGIHEWNCALESARR